MYVWLPINETVKITAILMAASPTATLSVIFAIRYNKNAILGAEIFAVTTLLSVFTIPLLMKIAELLS